MLKVSKEKWDSIPSDYKGKWKDYYNEHPEWKGRKTVMSVCLTENPNELCKLWVEGVYFVIEGTNEEKTIILLMNHYVGDNFHPSRQVKFIITEECLKDYLTEMGDERTVEEFLETYDSDEAEVVYGYAADDGRILSDEITYCDDFIDRYHDYIRRILMFNTDMTAEQIATKENYYWTVYAN